MTKILKKDGTPLSKRAMNLVKNGKIVQPDKRNRLTASEQLKRALSYATTKMGYSLIQHCVMKAYTNNDMAIAIMRKILPDKAENEIDLNIKTLVVRPAGRGGDPDE